MRTYGRHSCIQLACSILHDPGLQSKATFMCPSAQLLCFETEIQFCGSIFNLGSSPTTWFFAYTVVVSKKTAINLIGIRGDTFISLSPILDQILSADFLSKLSKLFEGENLVILTTSPAY